ncbi:hypothetical protein DDP54_15540 (plasmid) [Cellulomonas sp. WB94]|uniref:hypothetical protein n=1 Tax=Cellulomonas sp. WB94 TaxID=2173174 RepID=UPI000D578E5F|nr:hypothetical protein [Cellulomonas sp. WB94]PVU81314.1 hypothetical protein DDP54_15540 [Cellulomonas sp. WB94]
MADQFGGLTGANRDAYAALTNMLKTYGLESLAGTVLSFIQQGYSQDTVTVLLQNTDAYKQRFAANEVRRQKGLPVLSPSEYLSVEQSYRQIMSSAGLPVGYYDQTSDFQNLIANDVSPSEVQQRVTVAGELVNSIDPGVRAQWNQWYTNGDIVAYALDPTRARPVLERQYRAAEAGAFGKAQGLSLTVGQAEQVAATGASESELRQGMATASALASSGAKLSGIYGGTYTQQDALSETFMGDATATEKRRKLASQERAAFAGGSGVTEKSLSRQVSGQR